MRSAAGGEPFAIFEPAVPPEVGKTSKRLAQSNKSPDGGKATKRWRTIVVQVLE